MSTGTPDVGTSTPRPVEILVLPLLGLLLAGVIAGLVASVSVQLVNPWTGAGLHPQETGYAPRSRLRVPVGFSVLGTAAVAVLGPPSAWLGVGGPAVVGILQVLVVGIVLSAALHWVHFGAADPRQRKAGRYSYGVFAVVWTVTMSVYFALV